MLHFSLLFCLIDYFAVQNERSWKIIVHLCEPLNIIKVLIEEILSVAVTIESDSLLVRPSTRD